MDHVPDPVRHYLLLWLALVIAPAFVMLVAPSTAQSMGRFIRIVTKIWFLPVTLALKGLAWLLRWLRKP